MTGTTSAPRTAIAWWIVGAVAITTVAAAVAAGVLRADSENLLAKGLVAVVVGGGIGLLAAFLAGRPGGAETRPDDLRRMSGAAPLSFVVRATQAKGAAAGYRVLADEVRLLGVDGSLRIIEVTAVNRRARSATCATRLAVELAAGGARVALIDADLREGTIHRELSIDNHLGFSDALNGEPIDFVAQPIDPRLTVLTSGPPPRNALEALSRRRTDEVMATLRDDYDTVVVHAPPVLAHGDAAILSRHADGVIVVAANDTPMDQVNEAHRVLRDVRAAVTGYVLTDPAR